MKNLNDAMKGMKITNSFEDLYFLCKFQNISLATERWKIISRWKTPSADRHIAITFLHHRSILKQQSKVLKTTDRRDKAKGFRSVGVETLKD